MKFTFAVASFATALAFPALAAPFAPVGSSHSAFVKTEVVIPPEQHSGFTLASAKSGHASTKLLTVKPLEYTVQARTGRGGRYGQPIALVVHAGLRADFVPGDGSRGVGGSQTGGLSHTRGQ